MTEAAHKYKPGNKQTKRKKLGRKKSIKYQKTDGACNPSDTL